MSQPLMEEVSAGEQANSFEEKRPTEKIVSELPADNAPLALLAKVISFLFHPIFTASLGFAMLVYNGEGLALVETASTASLLQLTAITATAMPLALIALMVSLGLIRDIQMPARRSRILPMLTLFGYYLGLGLILQYKLPGAELVSQYLMLLAAITALTVAINFIYKISGHGISLGCFAGLYTLAGSLTGDFSLGVLLACTVLAGGIVGWARLYLNAHKPHEVYSGWVVGYAFGVFAGWVLLG